MIVGMDRETLRRRREAIGLTQGELARLLGVYQATISAWENGSRGIRHPVILARALDVLALDKMEADGVLTPRYRDREVWARYGLGEPRELLKGREDGA
jgi:transcriptional regulator with XRE-family HTH domain